MSAELIAILAAATALGGLILTQTGALRAEVRRLADRVDTLADRNGRPCRPRGAHRRAA